jgi:hypothetical protein
MPQDLIRYDLMVQEALKGVVRKLLIDAASSGLPGDHHFYISFRTPDPGVRISNRLREKYPEEMTIVLQHQFWDLGVTEHAFEVGLSFSGIPERLLVPFDSLTGFFDPSVQFGLKFELTGADPADNDEETAPEPAAPAALPAPARPARRKSDKPAAVDAAVKAPAAKGHDASAKGSAEQDDKTSDKPAGKSPAAKPAEAPPAGSAEVVSLDAFRKKP